MDWSPWAIYSCGVSQTLCSGHPTERDGHPIQEVTDQPETPPDPRLGQILDGRFELTEFIAQGGMGRVYKAIQLSCDRIGAPISTI